MAGHDAWGGSWLTAWLTSWSREPVVPSDDLFGGAMLGAITDISSTLGFISTVDNAMLGLIVVENGVEGAISGIENGSIGFINNDGNGIEGSIS